MRMVGGRITVEAKLGARLDARNRYGRNAAEQAPVEEIVRILLRVGAEPTTPYLQELAASMNRQSGFPMTEARIKARRACRSCRSPSTASRPTTSPIGALSCSRPAAWRSTRCYDPGCRLEGYSVRALTCRERPTDGLFGVIPKRRGFPQNFS